LGKKIIILIGVILLLDQIIKIWVKNSMEPNGTIGVIDGFFQLHYVENRGMAFGATLGAGAGPKYALSLFRLAAIVGIGWYILKLIRENTSPKGLIIAVGLVFAGATGNLIDGICYDLFWEVDELRPNGFLLGSVVDMFQFTSVWPTWMPIVNLNLPDFLGGANLIDIKPGDLIFGAIWNLADLSISIGVGLIIFRYRRLFRKPTTKKKSDETEPPPPPVQEEEAVTAVPTAE